MRFAFACTLFFAAIAGFNLAASAQISRSDAAAMGLEQAWTAQIQLPKVGKGLVSAHLWADPLVSKQYAVVETPSRTIRISADKLDKYGAPIGLEAAKKMASEQAARLLGKSTGFQVVEKSVPEIKLVTVSKDGMVQTLDAETGKLLWSTSCGHTSAPAHPAAVSPQGVVLIHGENLYLLDWETGKQKMVKHLRFASANAVAVCDDVAFVSDFSGRVEAYGLGKDIRPWGYVIHGRAVGAPVNLVDQSYTALASDRGFVYVFNSGNEPGIYIRYESADSISGCLGAGNGAFYVGTTGGTFAKISLRDRMGIIDWQVRTGQTMTAAPLIVGDIAIVANEAGEIVAVDDKTGLPKWISPAIRAMVPLGQIENRIFCRTFAGAIEAIDKNTGELIARTPPLDLSDPVTNQLDDRLYLVTGSGQIQCLRPIGGFLPNLTTPTAAGEESAEKKPQAETSQPENGSPFGNGPAATAEGNPFGGNPFGTAAPAGEEAKGSGDPFGGDPFGGDPFGGGSDPFGGGN